MVMEVLKVGSRYVELAAKKRHTAHSVFLVYLPFFYDLQKVFLNNKGRLIYSLHYKHIKNIAFKILIFLSMTDKRRTLYITLLFIRTTYECYLQYNTLDVVESYY